MDKIPSPEEQCQAIKKIEKESLVIGEKVCPISSQWFHYWKQQVNYDNDIEPIPNPLGPIDNSKIITNDRLNHNLQENIDYNLLHKESYDLLQRWYTGGPTIELDVISDSKGLPVVATNFLQLKINCKNTEKIIEAHKFMKISEVHKKSRQIFEISKETKTRLVNFFNYKVGDELEDDKYIENYQIISGEQILLDYQEGVEKKTWYSESIKKNSDLKGENISPLTTLSNRNTAGVVGFNNLGNTCYFNSGVQCLVHTIPLISKFLLSDEWCCDLNLTNKIGMKGELASCFASLVSDVWSGHYSTIRPSNLKNIIGLFRDTFSGNQQQDSHELIYAMLDGIHEDLNRCTNKPAVDSVVGDGTDDEEKAVEAWKRYKLINDSIIVGIFDGLFRSRLHCPKCNSETVVFDPFRSITVPIEKPHRLELKVVFVPFNFIEQRKTMKIEVNWSSNDDLNNSASYEISRRIGRTVKVKVGVQLYKGYPLLWNVKFITFRTATVYAFEMPNGFEDESSSLFTICRIEVNPKENTPGVVNFITKIGIPFLVDVTDLPDNFDENEGKQLFEKKVEEKLSKLWEENQKVGENQAKVDAVFKKKMDLTPPQGVTFSDPSQKLCVTFKTIQSFYSNCDQNKPKENIKRPCKTNNHFISSQAIIHINKESNFSALSLLRNVQTTTEKETKSKLTTLSDCFDFFSTPDVLDENNQWRCPKCKQFVCAEKKLGIWKLPKILIVQLKRFYGSGLSTRKVDTFVDFPEILDMKKFVLGPQKNENEIKYRLYAVSNQYGNLNSGHYTANARVKDPINPDDDKGWYEFNDSIVSKSSELSVHSAAAYVLFYERINE